MLKTVYFDAHHRHKWQCFRIRLVDKRLQDAVIKIKNLTSKNIEQNTAQKEIGHTSFLHSKHNSKDIER